MIELKKHTCGLQYDQQALTPEAREHIQQRSKDCARCTQEDVLKRLVAYLREVGFVHTKMTADLLEKQLRAAGIEVG
ncbi:hypothetical protein LCGC14_0637460 [marine sediment metagenome]|uniref:Uncharacterized protein n=1 Tax=marine sediment metagenome TaxID=412755 RepID=A0A0F9R034_9ZZZZ